MTDSVTRSPHVDAWLCDYAQVYSGRLVAVGAGTGIAASPSQAPPYVIHLWIAIVLTVPAELLGVPQRLKVTLVAQPGSATPQIEPTESEALVFDAEFDVHRPPPSGQSGDETAVPVAIPLVRTVPTLGPWAAVIDVAGNEARRLCFRVTPGARLPSLAGDVRIAMP